MVQSGLYTENNLRNDWKSIVHLTTEENALRCNETKGFKHVQDSFSLPLHKAILNLHGIDTLQLYLQLKKLAKPVLFIKPRQASNNKLIIKFTGKEDYLKLLDYLAMNLLSEGSSSIIISPKQLTKAFRKKEANLVKKASSIFEETYFIKLPIFTLSEYIEYAHHEKGSILVLPFSDLPSYLEIIKVSKTIRLIEPAVFVPIA